MAARAYIGGGDPVAPPQRATAPCLRGGRQAFFFRDLVVNLKKKITLKPCRPMGATGGIFEIFQNGHIFLKFWFFLNIKKKKAPGCQSPSSGPRWHWKPRETVMPLFFRNQWFILRRDKSPWADTTSAPWARSEHTIYSQWKQLESNIMLRVIYSYRK